MQITFPREYHVVIMSALEEKLRQIRKEHKERHPIGCPFHGLYVDAEKQLREMIAQIKEQAK